MQYYFEPTNAGGFRGKARTTLITTIENDVIATAQLYPSSVPIRQLKSSADLIVLKIAAQNRESWRDMILTIMKVVQAEALPNGRTNAKVP